MGELRLVKILRGFLFWLSIRRFEGGKKKKTWGQSQFRNNSDRRAWTISLLKKKKSKADGQFRLGRTKLEVLLSRVVKVSTHPGVVFLGVFLGKMLSREQ